MRGRLLLTSCLVLAACSKSPNLSTAKVDLFDVQEPSTSAARSGPQIAYTYTLSYIVAAHDVASVQARQLKLCANLGVARCRTVSSSMTAAKDEGSASGSATLLVDARTAESFGRKLDAVAADAGGIASSRATTAEDVTKQIIDTSARVRAKQALADRLLHIIQTANGKIGDLVDAEKAFADTQEQLDAARAEQAGLQQRVAMSQIDITYAAAEAGSIAAPLTQSLRNAGLTLGSSAATMVTLLIGALPWLVMLAILVWIGRRLGWRLPRRRARIETQRAEANRDAVG